MKITIQHVTGMYILLLMCIVIGIDSQLLPSPKELARYYVPPQILQEVSWRRLPYDDKVAHFFLVGALAFLANLSLSLSTVTIGKARLLKGSAALFVLATLEEGSQIFFPWRSFSLGDLVCNYAGIACFGWAAIYVARHQQAIEAKLPRRIAALLHSSK